VRFSNKKQLFKQLLKHLFENLMKNWFQQNLEKSENGAEIIDVDLVCGSAPNPLGSELFLMCFLFGTQGPSNLMSKGCFARDLTRPGQRPGEFFTTSATHQHLQYSKSQELWTPALTANVRKG